MTVIIVCTSRCCYNYCHFPSNVSMKKLWICFCFGYHISFKLVFSFAPQQKKIVSSCSYAFLLSLYNFTMHLHSWILPPYMIDWAIGFPTVYFLMVKNVISWVDFFSNSSSHYTQAKKCIFSNFTFFLSVSFPLGSRMSTHTFPAPSSIPYSVFFVGMLEMKMWFSRIQSVLLLSLILKQVVLVSIAL